jgi:hypothetical protein
LGRQAFSPLAAAPVPAWARASGKAWQGEPLFFAGAGLALLDAFLRHDPPCAGALRSRLALQSSAVSAKILRLNADEGALRDLRFAVGKELGPAAKLLTLWRELAGRAPNLDAGRLAAAAGWLDLALPDPNGLASEIFALWLFDLALPLRLRWARPAPLITTRILDPSIRSDGGGRRARPGDPAWQKAAAAGLGLAAASAPDLAADLLRRSDALLEVAPKLRAKPAQRIVDLLLAEDCVAPAEAARQAPMTGRAARRLFERLVALGAARELTGRPTFRLYGL